ncbi:iron ABC transporter permease [Clostridium boliviensis]|uniref:Iron ABC transporter permease n=1 Tax=Clostridium boliviensis TaxID=318465 RepID=A0ABU4GGM6_9CLOT|nr:iron ABC transporter permease [Clostridium boliviensis]MDW2796781.1 iron ABC transporter permease [Clostridium boliviensis]
MITYLKFSAAADKRGWLLLTSSFAFLIIFILLGLFSGASFIAPSAVFKVLIFGRTQDPVYRIFMTVRLPRVLGALLAGSGLAVSGSILQTVFHNPLASPNIIGVNAGAGLFVLICSILFPGARELVPFAAFLGALLASVLILIIAMTSRMSQLLLVLTGFVINSLFTAGMNAVLILFPDAYVGAGNFLAGGLSGLTASMLIYPSIGILGGILLSLCFAKGLNHLGLGAERAGSLGMNVPVIRCLAIAIAAALAGAAVSFAGLIGFVGLIIPHGVKLLIGTDNRFVLPDSALLGGILVILCDLLARTLFVPYELPVGIFLSVIGCPFFLYLILKSRKDRDMEC